MQRPQPELSKTVGGPGLAAPGWRRYFTSMADVCKENDKEKQDLVVVWEETKAKRDQIRSSMTKSRPKFQRRSVARAPAGERRALVGLVAHADA